MRRVIAALLLTLIAAPVAAGDLALTADQRAAFGALIRQTLLDQPDIIARALDRPDLYAADLYAADFYADEKAADLDLIAAHGAGLFGAWPATRQVAFFSDGCADCARAGDELAALAAQTGWTVHLHPLHSDLARSLGVPDAPFYVLPDLMIRGWMPAPALARYLD